jgi:hypothetical protein
MDNLNDLKNVDDEEEHLTLSAVSHCGNARTYKSYDQCPVVDLEIFPLDFAPVESRADEEKVEEDENG